MIVKFIRVEQLGEHLRDIWWQQKQYRIFPHYKITWWSWSFAISWWRSTTSGRSHTL